MDGALRNEFEKNAASLIPVNIVTEFVFGKASTITVPVTQQPNLDTLFEPADYPQSITVEHALCHGIEGKERLKLQRAIARYGHVRIELAAPINLFAVASSKRFRELMDSNTLSVKLGTRMEVTVSNSNMSALTVFKTVTERATRRKTKMQKTLIAATTRRKRTDQSCQHTTAAGRYT